MSMNKKLLAAAVAGLLVSGTASAAIDLDANTPRIYAKELVKPVLLTDTADNLTVKIGYNFSQGEVRYGRIECSANATMTVNGTPTVSGGSGDLELGAVNGINTNALFFSITDKGANTSATAADVLNFDVNTTLLDNNDVTCAFSIYDQPSQAQAGGATGRIYTTGSKLAYRSQKSFAFTSAGGRSIADVQATPAYTHFVAGDNLFGSLTFGLASTVPYDKDGSLITLTKIFAPTTKVVVSGSFNAATGVEWNNIARSSGNTSSSTWTGAGLLAGISGPLEYIENGTTEIAVSKYDALLDVDTNVGYTAADESLTDVGEIIRNGTELQAPLVQVPGGYYSRIFLTNTGSIARPFNIRVISETGNTVTVNPAKASGTIPANGSYQVLMTDLMTAFTGEKRATVIVTVDAPTAEIQGAYQIVNPSAGSVSNHVMVRPGTN